MPGFLSRWALIAVLHAGSLRGEVIAVDGAVPATMNAGGTAEDPAAYIIGDSGQFDRDFGSNAVSVGLSASFNSLIIRLGSDLSSGAGYLGLSDTSNGNRATITGSGSTWTNSDDLYTGVLGSANVLTVEGGGGADGDIGAGARNVRTAALWRVTGAGGLLASSFWKRTLCHERGGDSAGGELRGRSYRAFKLALEACNSSRSLTMEPLTGAGEAKLSELLLEVYAPGDLESFRERMLSVTHQVFGGEMVCHNEINVSTGESLSALCRPVDGFDALREAFFAHVEEHPSIQHLIAANGRETRAVKTSDFVSQRRWRNSGLYREFYRPLDDIRYQLTIGHREEDWLLFFAVSRADSDFTEEERSLLSLLRPHFIQGYQNARCYTELQKLRRNGNGGKLHAGESQEATMFSLMQRFGLTRREAEVLSHVAEGKSNSDIAESLHISLSTVKTHLQTIFRRMGVGSRAGALRMALGSLHRKSERSGVFV
jgi:T5SS/PEP-CTERM-associated repeat protein